MKDVRTVQDSFFKKNSHNHFNSANDDKTKIDTTIIPILTKKINTLIIPD